MTVTITLLDVHGVPVEQHEAPGCAGLYGIAPAPLDFDGQVAKVGARVEILSDEPDPRIAELLRELACLDELVRRAALHPENTTKLLGEINTRCAAFLKRWDATPLGI